MSDVDAEVAARRPVAKFAAGGVSIAVWRQKRQADGRTWDAFNCQIQNRYQDEAGEWQDSASYSPANLSDLLLVTLRALEFVRVRERDPRPAEEAGEPMPF